MNAINAINVMKVINATALKTIIVSSAALALLAACSSKQEASPDNFRKAMTTYLDKRGDLCLAKSTWPIDVAVGEEATTRNGVQMPVLEKLGLVTASDASDASVDKQDEDGKVTTLPVRRYQLTASGQQYYLPRAPHKRDTGNRYAAVSHDFCAVKLSLDQVVGWELSPAPDGKATEAVVTYTYKVDAAPWTSDADVQRVFPVVDGIVRGAGVRQLKEVFLLTSDGWEAKDL